jgi:hypothetical protein
VPEKEKDMRVIWDEIERTWIGIKSRTHKGRPSCWLMQDKWCLEGQTVLKDA